MLAQSGTCLLSLKTTLLSCTMVLSDIEVIPPDTIFFWGSVDDSKTGHLKNEKLWRFMCGVPFVDLPIHWDSKQPPVEAWWNGTGNLRVTIMVTRWYPRIWAGYHNITTYSGLCIKDVNILKCSFHLHFQSRRQLSAKLCGTGFITPGCAPRFALHKVSRPTDRRVLITVILKVKSFNSPPPEFQIVQVWKDGDRKRKMIRVEFGIFWMDALCHHKTDCEWLSLTSVCAATQSQRWGWRLCCYYLAVFLQPNKLQPNYYIGARYMQTATRRWCFRAHSVWVCDSSSCVGSLAGATYVTSHIDWYIYDSGNEAAQTELLHRTFSCCVLVVKALISTSVPHPKPQQSTSSPRQPRQLPRVWTQNRAKLRWSSSCQSSFSIARREIRMTWFRAILSDPAVWTVFLDALDAVGRACLDIYDAIVSPPHDCWHWRHHYTNILTGFHVSETEKAEWWSSGAPLALVKQRTWNRVLLGMHVLLHETKVFVELGNQLGCFCSPCKASVGLT